MYVQSVQNDCFRYSIGQICDILVGAGWFLEFSDVRVLVVVNIIRQPQQHDEGNEDDDANDGWALKAYDEQIGQFRILTVGLDLAWNEG